MVTERAARLRGASIGARLGTAFLAFILVLLLMGAVGIWRIAELEGVSAHMGNVDVRVERIVTAWHGETRLNLARSLVVARTDDQGLQHDLLTQMAATSKRISELQKQVGELTTSDAGKALVEAVGARRQTYLAVRKQVLDLRTSGRVDESLHLLETGLVPASNAYIAAIQAVVDHYSHAVDVYPASAHVAAEAGRAVLLALCVAGLVLGVLCSWLITRSITRPLGLAVHAARRVADGDLALRVASDRRDEVGALLRAVSDMAGGLRRLVAEVAGGARQLAETSAQIAQGNNDLSQRTEEQATTLEETAGAMEELTATVAQNSTNATQAAQLAGSTANIAGRGGAVVGEVVRTMDGITQASRRIGDILGVIDGIAFQTNILALNAAVEAARAGEEGRGFAVVAGEVRSLAQRSAAAAKEIKALIEDSRGQVEAGARLVRSAGETTTEMVASVQQVSALVAEIASASGEQRSGIEQVNSAVTQMDLVVQQNATLCEQAAAATESMKEQAAALLALVAQFRLEEEPAKWAQPQVRSMAPVLVPA